MLASVSDPLAHVLKRLASYANVNHESLTCDVVANYSDRAVLDISRYEAVELFLTSRVPNLHANHLIVDVDGFG